MLEMKFQHKANTFREVAHIRAKKTAGGQNTMSSSCQRHLVECKKYHHAYNAYNAYSADHVLLSYQTMLMLIWQDYLSSL